jgi:hypothetical protein
MATRPSQAASNRPGNSVSGGVGNGSLAVGHSAITRMAREDTKWFIVAVVILSLVLFLALPMALLILVDTERMKAEVRQEVRQLKRLKQEVKELQNVANRSGNRSEPD